MTIVDTAAAARFRRALASTSGNRDAMDAASAMLAAFNPHGGYEDASLLGGTKGAAISLAAGGGTSGAASSPVAHGPEVQTVAAVAHRVDHIDPKTLADAQAAVATAAHDPQAVSPDSASSSAAALIGDDTALAAHPSVRNGGAGFHDDPFAHLDTTSTDAPVQSGKLVGDDGVNTLVSGAGVVALFGGRGDDILVSNGDGDRLVGGGGADTFVFSAFVTARVGVIENLGRGDVVDLSQAAAGFGLDHFTAVTAFDHHAGEVIAAFDAAHDRTIFKFDTNGDGRTDYRLAVNHGDYTDYGHFLDVDHSGLVA